MHRDDPNCPLSVWLSLGRGGWSIHYVPYVTAGGSHYGNGSLSGYGSDWTKYVDELAPDVVGTDTTVMDDSDICTFAVSGPMADPSLPAGTYLPFCSQAAPAPWVDEPRAGRDPRFGCAGGFDYVALDVYLELVRRFGGRVFNPRTELEPCN